ncbi:MAG: hypothetical protein ACRCT1_15045 [Microcoleaceae cyanobacterium]
MPIPKKIKTRSRLITSSTIASDSPKRVSSHQARSWQLLNHKIIKSVRTIAGIKHQHL